MKAWFSLKDVAGTLITCASKAGELTRFWSARERACAACDNGAKPSSSWSPTKPEMLVMSGRLWAVDSRQDCLTVSGHPTRSVSGGDDSSIKQRWRKERWRRYSMLRASETLRKKTAPVLPSNQIPAKTSELHDVQKILYPLCIDIILLSLAVNVLSELQINHWNEMKKCQQIGHFWPG